MISTSHSNTWRKYLLVIMMLINVAVLLGFVWQIHRDHKQQETVVHTVLEDYAALAGQQFIRQIKSQIGYASMYDLSQQWLSPDNPQLGIIKYLETPQAELTTTRQRIRHNIHAISVYDIRQASLTAINHHNLVNYNHPAITVENIKDKLPIDRFMAIHDNHPSVSFTALLAINTEYLVVVTFAPELVTEVFDFIIQNRTLLPQVLLKSGEQTSSNSGLALQLNSPTKQTLWQVGQMQANMPQHHTMLDDDYGEFFIDHELVVGLDHQLAAQLIIGGLPQSQLPRLLALVLLASGSLLMLLVLLNQDRRLIRQRQQFIARASHELKTPLTQIRLFAETLALNRHQDEVTRATYIDIIHKESVRLSHLTEQILHQQQIEQGTAPQFETTIELNSWLQRLINEQQLLMETAQVCLHVNQPLHITTDPNQLKQVLINLLDNAIKFGPEQQTINLTVVPSKNHVRIKITDQGPGIPKADRPGIWSAYHRLPRDEHRGINGNGLGLSIALKLMQNLGGKIHCADCDVGACFEITLPLDDTEEANHAH